MTPTSRIFLNVFATYGRNLYSLIIGLLTARWTLQALGLVDYGLYGVVGGLTAFISFINNLFATAVGRFYAVEVGRAAVANNAEQGLEECRKWFSTAVFVHVLLPTFLMVVGYPIGVWAVKYFLTIPSDRVNDCVLVFRFVCITCYVGMIAVPFNAMYVARQYIAELTIYSFVTVSLNAVFLYYMIRHPGVWLTRYALWMCIMSVIPSVIIAVRSYFIFSECRFRLNYCISKQRFSRLLYFVGWWAFGQLGEMFRNQGVQVLINKYFGARVNAAMTIQLSVTGRTMMLSSAMNQAFQPAIVSAYGAGELDKMRSFAYRSCKFSMVLVLLFIIPLGLELKEILRIWLINPPQYVHGLCLIAFVMTVINQSAIGHMLAVNASGKIAKYQFFLGGALLSSLPLAWLFCHLGLGVYAVGFALMATMTICAWGRVWFARSLVGMSARYWGKNVLFPVLLIVAICLSVGSIPRFCLSPSIYRVVVTSLVCELVFLPLVYIVVLSSDERLFVRERISRCVHC